MSDSAVFVTSWGGKTRLTAYTKELYGPLEFAVMEPIRRHRVSLLVLGRAVEGSRASPLACLAHESGVKHEIDEEQHEARASIRGADHRTLVSRL